MKINSELDSLFNLIIDGTKTDDSKIANINEKIQKAKETIRDVNLTSMEAGSDDDDFPGYLSDSEEEEETKKRRLSQTPSGGSTPSKRVAFSEDVEVFEDPDENKEESVSVDVMSLLSKLVD